MTVLLYLKLGVLAVVLAIGGYFVWSYQHTKAELVIANAEVSDLGSKLKLQNDAVQKLKTDSEVRGAKGIVLVAEAKKTSALNQTQASIIYKTLPSIPSDDCKSALILGNTK